MANNSSINDSSSGPQPSLPDDHDKAIEFIVEQLKSKGIFDSIRRECLSDIDTKAGFQNLTQRIQGYVSRYLDKQKWTPSLNKNQLREKLRRELNDSSMLKYGLDAFVEGAIGSKKRSFAPQIRQIIQEYLGTTVENEDDNVNTRDHSSYDKYNSHHSYNRNDRSDRYDRDYYHSNHSRRSDYDSTSVMEYDVDNTEQDMEVDDSNSSQSSSSQSEEEEINNEVDSSVQARLNSFLQTFKEFSKNKQQLQESVVNSAESVSSSDSRDVMDKISDKVSSEETTKPTSDTSPTHIKTEPEDTGPSSSLPVPEPTPLETDTLPQTVEEMRESYSENPSTQPTVTNINIEIENVVNVKKEPVIATPVPNVPDVPLEEILSDVSSVHTSDLSDFDDRISISSSEELSLYAATGEGQEPLSLSVTLNSTVAPTATSCGRRKISLQEVKQQLQAGERVTSASSSIASSSGSNSQGTKGQAKKVHSNSIVTSPAQNPDNKQYTSSKGRQRKINPRYASDEYFI